METLLIRQFSNSKTIYIQEIYICKLFLRINRFNILIYTKGIWGLIVRKVFMGCILNKESAWN